MAEDFRVQLSVLGSASESDVLESDAGLLTAEIFFSPVDSSKGPLAEAAFLSQSSSFAIGLGRGEGDEEFEPDEFSNLTGDAALDADVRFAGLTYVIPSSKVILGLSRTVNENEKGLKTMALTGGSLIVATEVISTELTVGLFLSDSRSVQVSYGNVETTVFLGEPFSLTLEDAESSFFGLAYKRVDSIAGGHISWSANVSIFDEEDANEVLLAATYYPRINLGVGIEVSRFDADDSPVLENYGLELEYFVIPRVAVSVEVSHEDLGDSDEDENAVALGLTARF